MLCKSCSVAKLQYSAICSVDGFMADEQGNFDWAAPDEQVHAFVNELESGIGTHLYGRRMYEVMRVWEEQEWLDDEPDVVRDYARIWGLADKHVFSETLDSVSTARTRLHRTFDPAAITQLKASSARDISIGGATLAAHAMRAGLVDEFHLVIVPVLVGGGTSVMPLGIRLNLELIDMRRFDSGFVHLHYRTA